MLPAIRFEVVRASEECGCPEEEWVVGNCTLIMHFEDDGSIHGLLDAGDWDADKTFRGFCSLDAARPSIFDWVASLFRGDA
ncbi:MAG: hypothetical protein ACOY5R_06730 [Pseudomonadota bacterium]